MGQKKHELPAATYLLLSLIVDSLIGIIVQNHQI